MKRLLSVFFCIIGFTSLFAGGIVTNTNQSASWARNPSTAAITGIEATYYNPAATTKLGEGLFFSLSNQSIFQTREIENSFSYLNDKKFEGKINAPIFPSIYAVYNVNKFSFSFGFNPLGGGGGAEFKKGLPSFELPVAGLYKTFQTAGVTGYSLSTYFKATSIYFGYQFGVSYKINDMISVYAGARYVTAKNTYEGYLKDINVVTTGGPSKPGVFMTNLASTFNGYAAGVGSFATAMGGTTTFDQAIAATAGDATQQAKVTALRDGLTSLGVADAGSQTLSYGQARYTGQAVYITAQVPGATALTADQEADVEQTGSGISPIIGVNLSLLDQKLNVGLKYEFATKMDVKNKTTKDVITGFNGTTPITMFPNEAKVPADMPAMLSLGVSYKVTEKLKLSGSFYTYFDKNVSYGKKSSTIKTNPPYVSNDSLMDNNFYEFAFGVEYQLIDKLLVSAGILMGNTGIKPEYNSDLSFSNNSTTYGLGLKYAISSKMDVNLGYAYSAYKKKEKTIAAYNATESYTKNTMIIAVGVDIKFGK